MNVKEFQTAVDAIAEAKGISHQAVINALHDALQAAYIRYLRGGSDAVVEVNIDEENGYVTIAQVKNVVAEVQDDYLEISPEDAKENAEETLQRIQDDLSELKRNQASQKNDMRHLADLVKTEEKGIKVGGTYRVYCPFETLSKLTTASIKNVLRQKIAEAGHEVLYEIYKDHIGELVTGTVEAVSPNSVSVNIGKGTTDLYKEDLIGEEDFKPGDPIKVYIEEVKQPKDENGHSPKGAQIKATRSTEGFLKRLFEEEIHEIYDGTVVIKGIARRAGVRSKVAVASVNDDVDPIGACIGPGGSRIQKIVSQLGNAKYKEKIDIIPYSDYTPLYLAESLRPVEVLGVKIIDEHSLPYPTAAVVIDDDQYAVAIGKRGSNAILANKLTGWNIRVYKKSDAEKEGLDYVPLETIQKEAAEFKKNQERAAYAKRSAEEAAARAEETKAAIAPATPVMPEGDEIEGEEALETPVVAPSASEEAPTTASESPLPEEKPAETPLAPASEPTKETVTPVEPLAVKTTKTLDELEKELAESSQAEKKGGRSFHEKGKAKRPHNISEKEVARAKPEETPSSKMPIYSDEELAEIEKEENAEQLDPNGEDESYEDYSDYDDYYDDKK